MSYQIQCPSCSRRLHVPKLNIYPENNLEIICRNCKYKYAVVHGEVSAFSVRLEQPTGDNFRLRYKWAYELRLLTALGVKVLQFLITSRTQSFLATVGDRVNVFYPMKRDTVLKNIMCIQNLTTEKTCVLFHRKDILFFRALATILPTTLAAILANLSPSATGKLLIAGSLPLDEGKTCLKRAAPYTTQIIRDADRYPKKGAARFR